MAMSEKLQKMVEIYVTGRVRVICFNHGLREQDEIKAVREQMIYEINSALEQGSIGVAECQQFMTNRLNRLDEELGLFMKSVAAVDNIEKASADASSEEKDVETESSSRKSGDAKSRGPGHQPQAEGQSEKLQEQRKPVSKMILEDCVRLGLVEKERAKHLVRQMPGKPPREAEMEVVAELRNNLHEQMRKFMRKHKGGPWTSPKQQEEVRMDITQTPTVRSLVQMTLHLLKEQEIWLKENDSSIATRLFGLRGKG